MSTRDTVSSIFSDSFCSMHTTIFKFRLCFALNTCLGIKPSMQYNCNSEGPAFASSASILDAREVCSQVCCLALTSLTELCLLPMHYGCALQQELLAIFGQLHTIARNLLCQAENIQQLLSVQPNGDSMYMLTLLSCSTQTSATWVHWQSLGLSKNPCPKRVV